MSTVLSKQELQLTQYLTNTDKITGSIIPHLLSAYKNGVISPTSKSSVLRELAEVIRQSNHRSRPLIWDSQQKIFKVHPYRYIQESLSNYSTRVEENTDAWRRYKGHINSRRVIQPSVSSITSGSTQTIPLYGIELECAYQYHTSTLGVLSVYDQVKEIFGGSEKCDIKYDSSTGERGMEIVSTPQTFHQLRRTISRALRPAVTHTLIEVDTDYHGIHIHLSAEPLTTTQMAYLFYICHIDTFDNFFEMLTDRSYDDEYGKRVGGTWFAKHDDARRYLTNYLPQFDDLLRFLSEENRGSLHYSRSHRTLEFRCFNSSTDPETVLSYLEFVDALQTFCLLSNGGVKITKNTIRPIDFVRWLMDGQNIGGMANLKPRKLYPHLVRRIVLDLYPHNFIVTTDGLVTITGTVF